MKHQLAIAAIALSLAGAAFADPQPTSVAGVTTQGPTYSYQFDYVAANSTVAPNFVTTVTSTPAGTVTANTPLAYTVFRAPEGTSAVYNLQAAYSANAGEYQAYFSNTNSAGTVANTSVNNVVAGDEVHIVLATKTTQLSAGTTHVTYTINSFAS
ncbi:hypothetical protein OHR01_005175 [Salmonella enterica]|nr:hypothetical protein [Salmonella enterica]EKG3678939.1 hypothetical protein [Salmonella enterica]